MGSSLLDPRRKRRRTRAQSAGLRHAGEKKRCAVSLPWVAVVFGLGMVVAVGIRREVKSSARHAARDARIREKSGYPLLLLLEQHDIDPQAARFADPLRRCLANSYGEEDEPPAERLGLFTCIADTRFFLSAVREESRFPSVAVVDVGGPPFHLEYEMGDAAPGFVFAGRQSDTVPEMGLQTRLKAGDTLPHTAGVVLIEAHDEEALSADAWVDLIHSWMLILSERGVIVIRGPREKGEKERAVGGEGDTWYGNTHLWEAIATLACDDRYGVAAAVGDFDRGLIVLRHAGASDAGLGAGCGSQTENQARSIAPPRPLQFEELFLWATEGQYTATASAVEAVPAKFGGVAAVRRHARRLRERSACLSANTYTGGEAAAPTESGIQVGRLRASNFHSSPSHGGVHVAYQHYQPARACLERHLQEHTDDVRAGFALEMVLRSIGGNGVDRQVARVRAKMTEEAGPLGNLLWRELHARAAGAAATGNLL